MVTILSRPQCVNSVITGDSPTDCDVYWHSMHREHYTNITHTHIYTVYPKKYAHGLVVLCFVVVMQSFIMNSHEVFIHIHQGCFAGTGAIVRLPQCQWSKPDGYGKISQCITTTKQKPCAYFLGYTVYIYVCVYPYFIRVVQIHLHEW